MLDNRKGVIIVIDGFGDRPAEVLGRQTPLEAAETANFDRLVTQGMCGLVDRFVPGMPVGTHTSTSLLSRLGQLVRTARLIHKLMAAITEPNG